MPRLRWLPALVLCLPSPAAAQEAVPRTAEPVRRVYDAVRAPSAPRIDGLLDDPAWQAASWTGDFLQREPAEGVAPTAQTRFKVLYDDETL
jgi:hypothetical protein